MSEDVTIRSATLDDAEVLAQFNEEMARETEDKALDPETVRAGVRSVFENEDRGAFYLVAERGEPIAGSHSERTSSRVVGALMVTTEWSDWRNAAFWWIQSVYVRPEARRTGVYTALHRVVRQRAREAPDVCGLRLYVERDNTAARQAYEALGMDEPPYRMYEEMLD